MLQDLAIRISQEPPETIVFLLFLVAIRPVGLMFGFIAFAWGLGSSFMIRAGIGLMLGIPMALIGLDQSLDIANRQDVGEMAVILSKEFVLGLALGLLASMPFYALKTAGELVDQFRGEAESGHTNPEGGTISTLGQVFLILGFFIFFSTGGLWLLCGMLYRSYTIWAVAAPLPPLSADAAMVAVDLVKGFLVLAIVTAAPLMLLLFAAEFIVAIGARAAERFELMQYEYLAKNLVTVLFIPLIVLYAARVAEEHIPDSQMALPLLEAMLR